MSQFRPSGCLFASPAFSPFLFFIFARLRLSVAHPRCEFARHFSHIPRPSPLRPQRLRVPTHLLPFSCPRFPDFPTPRLPDLDFIPRSRAFTFHRLSRRWTSGRRVFGWPMISVLVTRSHFFDSIRFFLGLALRIFSSLNSCTRSLDPASARFALPYFYYSDSQIQASALFCADLSAARDLHRLKSKIILNLRTLQTVVSN